MSGFTMTMNEVLYSNWGPGTTTTTSATAQSMIVGMPEIIVPGGFMKNVGRSSSTLRLKLGGLITSTASPTFTVGLYTTSVTPAAFLTTNLIVSSAAFTPASVTNAPFSMELEIGLRTLTPGAASTVVSTGWIESPAGFASPFRFTIPTTGTVTGFTGWEADLQYFLWPFLTLSAATAGNTITTEYAKLYGEN